MSSVDGARDDNEMGDIASQENVASRNGATANRQSKQQVRHRASVACASCRDRRIRCVVPQGQSQCNQCQRSGTECIIKNDDERRRPISKAYMSSLSDRISMLESLLKDKGVKPPPANHPPKTKHESQQKPDESLKRPLEDDSAHQHRTIMPHQSLSPSINVPSPPDSRSEDSIKADGEHPDSIAASAAEAASMHQQPFIGEGSPLRMFDPRQEDTVHNLFNSNGNLSFDQLSGRLRFFGPTANSHVYAATADRFDSREPPEQVRRAERIIRSLNGATYDYLMTNFWDYYNSVIQVIDRDSFEGDRESQNPKYYSSFLHICILAMGYRGTDLERDDMKRISLGNRESTLHREAKFMLDIELERPGGIPSVQALLLLGDLECGVGRDNTGWMYSGMANRLAFDIGLHLDCCNDDVPEQEIQIRRTVMRACVIYDKYWALFLGRPTSIKSQDVGMDLLSNRFSMLSSGYMSSSSPQQTMNNDIYGQLIELMDLAGRIVDTRTHQVIKRQVDHNNIFAHSEAEDNAYLHVVNLDRQLQNWYRRLPDHLAWKPSNIKTAPFSFFLLHQQYHVSMILLHRPWAKYDTSDGSSSGSRTGSHSSPESNQVGTENSTTSPVIIDRETSMGLGDPHSMVHDSRASLSRSICTQQAIRVARIFWQHRQRFDGRKIFVTGIQHAGTAVLALIASLAFHKSDSDRRTYMGYLEILSDALGDMSHTYHPAARMDELLKLVLTQVRINLGEVPGDLQRNFGFPASGSSDAFIPVVPSRRGGASDAQYSQPTKRRRRPGGGSRRASELPRPPPPFFQSQPTPPQSNNAQLHQLFNGDGEGGHYRHRSNAEPSFSMPHGLYELDLNFLGNSGMDMDIGHDMGSSTGRSDELALVTPSSDIWGLGRVHGEQSHPQPPVERGGFEALLDDFSSGPAGLSASSVLEQTPEMSKMNSMNKRSDDISDARRSGTVVVDPDLASMSPLSMSSLMQTTDKGPASEHAGNGSGQRNHELDFFSFS